ncbi:MAG TPA: FMN-binding protein [Streptosporangiaceae bacterium]|nr:FMN-binding protein [Streptosporangiaceae bacterium]
MKSAPWLVLAGTVAGFLGVLGFHKPPSTAALAGTGGQPASKAGKGAGAQAKAPAGPVAGASAGTFSGAMEQYGYGELTAQVSITGGRITAVSVPVLRTAEQYSQQLAAQVIPMLRNEVLAAQSASINAVSGATYTSQAYALSIQAALDKAHFK